MMLSLLNCCVRSTDCFGVVGDVVVLVDGLVNVNSVVLHWSFYWWFVQVLSVPLLGILLEDIDHGQLMMSRFKETREHDRRIRHEVEVSKVCKRT